LKTGGFLAHRKSSIFARLEARPFKASKNDVRGGKSITPLPLTTDFPPLKPIFQQARRKAKIPHFVNSKAKGFLVYQKTRGFRIKHEKLPLPPLRGNLPFLHALLFIT
jgi:hypothetical protein